MSPSAQDIGGHSYNNSLFFFAQATEKADLFANCPRGAKRNGDCYAQRDAEKCCIISLDASFLHNSHRGISTKGVPDSISACQL